MKLFAKLMLALVFIAMLLPFTILKGPDGGTLMSFSSFELPDFSLPDLPKLPDGSKLSSSLDGGGKDVFYKWYDSAGNVQFTTEPPANGIEYSVLGYDPNTNVIQSVKLPIEEPEEPKPSEQPVKADESGNPYDPDRIKKLLDDAKNVEKLLKQRIQDQEAAINQ